MKTNINQTPLKLYKQIPVSWKSRRNTINYNLLPESELYADGWRDLVVPSYDLNTQKLGALEYDSVNDYVTYQVIDLTPEEIDAKNKVYVPFSITPTQGRLLLHRMKLLSGVKNAMKNSIDEEMNIYWENALSWDRDNSYIKAMAVQLGMSDIELDNFFIEASKIN